MEAVVVGAGLGATVKVLIQNLITISMKEIKLIRSFKKDLKKLRSTLFTIQEFVNDVESLAVTNLSVIRWVKKLEDVAFEAYNVLDEVHYKSLREDRHKMETQISCIKFMSLNFHDHWKFGHIIRKINKDFESINKEASGLGLQSRLAGLHAATRFAWDASASSETDSMTFDPVFLGRDDDVKEIVEKLTNFPTQEVFHIIPIVGMGGMGKSTLAREVIKVQTHFQTHIWVHVSANFKAITLFKKILMILTSEDVKLYNREVVLKKLRVALENKTYLLVLDDACTGDRYVWEGFVYSLSGVTSTKGNAIIFTTRKRNVASIVATLPIYDLKGLPEDSCWSIIKAKAFGGDMIPSEFETLGRNIAKSCKGLPLAANVVGGVLRGKSKDEWVSIQENWLYGQVEGDFIEKVLKLSFDYLPSPLLKKCFAYCSIFPKGDFIERKELIELWMAEGFLEADQISDMETVGNKYLNLLVHNSLLQDVGKDGFSNELLYSMHDLVHDVAIKVNSSNLADDMSARVRYTGYEGLGDDSESYLLEEHIEEDHKEYVRTLIFNGDISDKMLSDFKSLHALSLVDSYIKELTSSIKELIHLRYLNVSYTQIERLPSTIGELYHLQTFRARSSSLKNLPSTLKYLISLRHLYVYDHTKLPGELGRLTSLQTIPYFEVGDEKGHRIGELGSLKNLKGELRIYNLERVTSKQEAKSACIFQKPNIIELVLRWNELREGETNYENVLEGLQPHPNLKSLEIDGFKGARFPTWTLNMTVGDEGNWKGLNNLTEVTLKSCTKCEEIPMMGHLPHLKSLYLSNLRNVKSIGSSFYGIDHCRSACRDTVLVFPALERLVLQDMPNMRDWEEAESQNQSRQVKVFPCLEYMVISNCKELKSAPSRFPCLKELEIYKMDSGVPLANICSTKLTSLTKLEIEELQELESLPNGLFSSNQHLSKLQIRNCPNLRDLADDMHAINSIRELIIERCPNPRLRSDVPGIDFTTETRSCIVIRFLGKLILVSLILFVLIYFHILVFISN